MGLTQQQVARRAGVSQATISDYENDKIAGHRASELMRIAAALETTVDYLAHGVGPESISDAETDIETLTVTFNRLPPSARAALIAAAKAMAEEHKK